jgi:outer membrane protein
MMSFSISICCKRKKLVFNAGLVLFFIFCLWAEAPAETSPPIKIVQKNSVPVTLPDEGPLAISLTDAVMLALQNNPALAVEKLNPAIAQTVVDQQKAVFDPEAAASFVVEQTDAERQIVTGARRRKTSTKSYEAGIALEKFFPTGTTVILEADNSRTDSSLFTDDLVQSRVGISVTQALLNGYGNEVNLVDLRQATLDVKISQYDLRGFSESLLAEVENAYWQYALALRQIEIVEESLKVAQQQLDETRSMIKIGTLAEAELTAAQAEVALQRQVHINTKSALQTTRLQLIRLLNPPLNNFWDRELKLVLKPELPQGEMEAVGRHVAVALKMRPELNQAKLEIQQGELEIVRTKNGLLPRLDLFIALGKSGYADSFAGSIGNITDDSFDVSAGLTFAFPLKNRSAKARHKQSTLSHARSLKAYGNLVKLVEMDVRTAYIEIKRTKAQISASTATRALQQEKLRIETEKFKVGRSTNFLVAQAQRDLLAARIAEVSALVNHLMAQTDFYRLEGSLLYRRKISAPDSEPVVFPDT